MNWKKIVQIGDTVQLREIEFAVHHIGKRGLILRPVKPKPKEDDRDLQNNEPDKR